MASWSAKLAELGIELPAVAKPVAAYVPAQLIGREIRTSGQLPSVDGALVASGKVGDPDRGGTVTPDEAYKCARVAALNALAAVASVAGGIDRIERISHVTGFVASVPSFTGQPSVVNGASELLQAIFGDAGSHTRSAVGVAVLPLNAPVEIELTAVLRG